MPPGRAWTGGLRRAPAPWWAGEPYPNLVADADPERLRAAYAQGVWERLQDIRAEWDPERVFGHA